MQWLTLGSVALALVAGTGESQQRSDRQGPDPAVHDLARKDGERGGVYHRLPSERGVLVVFEADAEGSRTLRFLIRHGGEASDRHPIPGVRVVDHKTEAGRLAAQWAAHRNDLPVQPEPLVSIEPLTTLTRRMVVRFRDAEAHSRSVGGILAAGYKEERRLPYVEHGYVYRREIAEFSMYRTARGLIARGDALYAVPLLRRFPREEQAVRGGAASPELSGADYLEEMNLYRAWVRTRRQVGDVVIAVLDDGLQGNIYPNPVCERLRVEAVFDFTNGKLCQPDEGTDWCDGCAALLDPTNGWCTEHGNRVALVAGATHGVDGLRGVAPDVRLIGARDWSDLDTDEQFSDALWWLAGGDPGTGVFEPLQAGDGASVINLSFSRESLLEEDCADSLCAVICADVSPCGMVEDLLARLRSPKPGDGPRDLGVVVVNAIGNEPNDLWRSPDTVAVGSVRFDGDTDRWTPFDTTDTSECYEGDPLGSVHCFGDEIDVVAPLGSDNVKMGICDACMECKPSNGCMLCPSTTAEPLEFGSSSAAAGAVSGLVALMLEAGKDKLSADQVHCILRETADPRNGEGGEWKDGTVVSQTFDCSFDSDGHSDCFGRGMVDALEAVVAAKACKSRSEGCPGPCVELPPTAAKDRPPRADPPGKKRGKGRQ